jgi:hypothetical protein
MHRDGAGVESAFGAVINVPSSFLILPSSVLTLPSSFPFVHGEEGEIKELTPATVFNEE